MVNDDFPPTLPEAGEDIESALAFEEKRSPAAARQLSDGIIAAMALIKLYPDSGSPYMDDTRRVVIRRTKYQLIYRHRDPDVLVVALAHSSQQPGYWLDRLQ